MKAGDLIEVKSKKEVLKGRLVNSDAKRLAF